jgi:PAS domain S-box-containing protein
MARKPSYKELERRVQEPEKEMLLRTGAETSLQENANLYRSLVEISSDWLWEVDVDGRYTYVNSRVGEILGYAPEEVVGRTPFDFMPEEEANRFGTIFEEFLAERRPFALLENVSLHRDGRRVALETGGVPVFDSEGEFRGYRGFIRDITERKLAEEVLKETERKFRAIFDQRFQLMGLLTIEGRMMAANGNALGFAGIKESDVVGKLFWETEWWKHSAELREKLRAAVKRAAAGDFVSFETTHPSAAGNLHCMDFSLKPIMDESRTVSFLIAEARDINERKGVEEALRNNETRLRAITDSAQDAILMMGPEGAITFWNPAAERILGYTGEEAIGQNLHKLLAPARYHDAHWQAFSGFAKTGQGEAVGKTLELVARRKDGEEIPVELSLSAVYLNGWQAVGVLRDITERKHAEYALKESQQRLGDIIDFLPDATFVIDKEGKVIAWNRAMEEMVGIRAADMVGKSYYEYAMPFYGERRPTLADLVLEPLNKAQVEYPAIKKEGGVLAGLAHLPDLRGREAYLFATASALCDSEGNIVGAIESIRDITEQKRMEEAVAKAEEKYREIFENSITAIYQITMEGRFLSVNMAGARIMGYESPEEMLDSVKNFREFYVHPERRAELLRMIEEQGFVREFEAEYIRKDKSLVWLSLNARVVRNSAGDIAYMEGTAMDITDRKALQSQLEQAQKMEAIGTLAGGIAHDFNNILAPIIGYSELSLNVVPEDNRLSHNLRQILLSANRAKDLVGQILTFSRKTRQERRSVQVGIIMNEALKLLRSTIPSTIDIRQSIRPDAMDGAIMADPTRIHQVIINLCTNAAHAMREQGGTLSVTLENVEINSRIRRPHFPEPGSYLKLSVADTGHGMEEVVRKRIFDPYFTTKGPNEGTGLGLAVVYGIVKNLSGAITVQSRPGKGTTFDVYFPRGEMAQAAATELSKPLPTGHGRILVVDDEKSIVDMMKEVVETLGYESVLRYSSTEALTAFRAEPDSFDLVITDMTMPCMTGTDLATEILMIRPQIPIILCTGFSDTVDVNKTRLLGIRKLLIKPVSMSDLAAAVNKALDETTCPAFPL